ncbi:hypothetical protein HKD37_02G005575 [Glycine soja]
MAMKQRGSASGCNFFQWCPNDINDKDLVIARQRRKINNLKSSLKAKEKWLKIFIGFHLRQIAQTRSLLETNSQKGAVLKLFSGGSVSEGDSPVELASWTRDGAWGTRQWSWRVAVHVAGPATQAGPATWTTTRQLYWRVPQAPPCVQLASSTGESPSETDPLKKSFKTTPFWELVSKRDLHLHVHRHRSIITKHKSMSTSHRSFITISSSSES